MPPRKSLPAASSTTHRPTPKRVQSSTPRTMTVPNGSAPRKRLRRTETEDDLESIEAEPGPEAPVTRQSNGVKAETEGSGAMDPEKELEHWQDFAVEHYEMVEQLPLELHRNYRLLRELDDGVAVHAEKLQNTIRNYIAYRLGDSVKPTQITAEGNLPALVPPLPSLSLDGGAGPVDADGNELTSVLDLGVPESDGHGGQVMPAPHPAEVVQDLPAKESEIEGEAEVAQVEEAVRATDDLGLFSSASPTRPEAEAIKQDSLEMEQSEKKRNRGWELLPEIARLAKEMVKNGEEKVAVAQGAYNSIDRHIRALDSALSSQEASILLGLRPDTLPSTAVENGLENGDTGALADNDDGTIGTGGGGVRRKGRAARGRARAGARAGKAPPPVEEIPAAPVPPVVIDADPNEPTYCYCNQVSFGEMIGCDNDDCPIEWVHLGCAGLSAAPAGKWLCDICDPNSARNKAEKATGVAKAAGRGGRGTRGKARGRQTR